MALSGPRPADVTTTMLSADEIVRRTPAGGWRLVSSALAPDRLARSTDRRWATTFLAGLVGDDIEGVLSLHRFHGSVFPAGIHDPAVVAPEVFAGARSADSYLLIGGGFRELVSGYTMAPGSVEELRAPVARALVDAAFQHADGSGLVGAALYVRDEQMVAFQDPELGRAAQAVEEFAQLTMEPPTVDGYLSGLNHGRRSVVRRDWRRIDELSLRSRVCPAAEVVDEAAGLVAAVQRRHNLPDHPRLAAVRLRSWAAETLGRRLAFVVRNAGAGLAAVSFACHRDDVLELYEIGLADTPVRHLSYVEAMLYGPVRYAIQADCRVIQLGIGASRPKALRGARLSPVWAVGARA
jgi:hypothetical protein